MALGFFQRGVLLHKLGQFEEVRLAVFKRFTAQYCIFEQLLKRVMEPH